MNGKGRAVVAKNRASRRSDKSDKADLLERMREAIDSKKGSGNNE